MDRRKRTEINSWKRKGRKIDTFIERMVPYVCAYRLYVSYMVQNVYFQIEYVFQSVYFMIHVLMVPSFLLKMTVAWDVMPCSLVEEYWQLWRAHTNWNTHIPSVTWGHANCFCCSYMF
jgi:hypothetical protein